MKRERDLWDDLMADEDPPSEPEWANIEERGAGLWLWLIVVLVLGTLCWWFRG